MQRKCRNAPKHQSLLPWCKVASVHHAGLRSRKQPKITAEEKGWLVDKRRSEGFFFFFVKLADASLFLCAQLKSLYTK